jgi:ComF family protein
MASLLSALTDLVLAPTCLGCREAMSPGDPTRPVCRRCRSRFEAPAPPLCPRCGAPLLATGRRIDDRCTDCRIWPRCLHAARSACHYRDPAARLVRALKYQGWSVAATALAESMARVSLPPDVELEARICVPVPTTAARRRQRGYDQAVLLADAYAARTGRVVRSVLRREGNARTQTALQPAARGANVAGGFQPDARLVAEIAGAHVLLVDDVLTTGATAAECARTLVAAGVRRCSLITFARALEARS